MSDVTCLPFFCPVKGQLIEPDLESDYSGIEI